MAAVDAGRFGLVLEEVRAVKEACGRAHLKVILETGELATYDNVRRASWIAMIGGADFVKTSTGKVNPAATLPVALVMLEAVRDFADISGTVTCASPTTVDVEVDLTQYYKRFVFFNYADSIVQCTTSPTDWTVDVPPGNGLCGVGRSMAEVYFEAQFGTTYKDVEISGNVKLAKGKP